MRFDMEKLPMMVTGDGRILRWGNNGSWRQFDVKQQRVVGPNYGTVREVVSD